MISIEGGYEQVLDNYFIVTYASIIDNSGERFVGKSQGLQISKEMFEWVKNGKSLNKVIELIEGCSENKKDNGISGYLTSSYYKRSVFDSFAVISALVTMLNQEKNIKDWTKNCKMKWMIMENLEKNIPKTEHQFVDTDLFNRFTKSL